MVQLQTNIQPPPQQPLLCIPHRQNRDCQHCTLRITIFYLSFYGDWKGSLKNSSSNTFPSRDITSKIIATTQWSPMHSPTFPSSLTVLLSSPSLQYAHARLIRKVHCPSARQQVHLAPVSSRRIFWCFLYAGGYAPKPICFPSSRSRCINISHYNIFWVDE